MKLLKFGIKNFKKLNDNFNFSFVPTGNKSLEDKEFELSEIDNNLFVFNTIGIVGKNASGKTTTTEALNIIYDILSNFKIKKSFNYFSKNMNDIELSFYFYNENNLYYYRTILSYNKINEYISFKNEELYSAIYYKSYSNDLFNLKKYKKISLEKNIPDDTSILFMILKDIIIRGDYYEPIVESFRVFDSLIEFYNNFKENLFNTTIELLDEHITSITMKNENIFIVTYKNKKQEEKTHDELFYSLSSGTIKGLNLYLDALYSLFMGYDYIVDEIETHFHKTLVENIINLYKDKRINKHGATLIFTTHYPELLDLFNRTDNIYICDYKNDITIKSMYNFNLRSDAIKSKKFYENTFNTAINYEILMKFLKELL